MRTPALDALINRVIVPHEGSLTVEIDPTDYRAYRHIHGCESGHKLVYTLKNAGGQVLYVGVTYSAKYRFAQHKADKCWWGDVASADLTCFSSNREALDQEMRLIRTIAPIHNKRGAIK